MSFILSFNSTETHCKMIVMSLGRKRITCRMKINFQISRFINSYSKLTIMHYDKKNVIFGANSLLFFISLEKMDCKVFTYKDMMFSGVIKTKNQKMVDQLIQTIGEGRELIRYEDNSQFYIIAEESNKLYTYKNQFRLKSEKEVRFLESRTSLINPDLYTIKMMSCSEDSTKEINTYYGSNIIPLNMES